MGALQPCNVGLVVREPPKILVGWATVHLSPLPTNNWSVCSLLLTKIIKFGTTIKDIKDVRF